MQITQTPSPDSVAEVLRTGRTLGALELPLTTEISGQHSAILLISHPGWSRRLNSAAENQAMQRWCDREIAIRGTGNSHYDAKLANVVLPKVWYAETGKITQLLTEIMAEHALHLATQHSMPVVITVPCAILHDSRGGKKLIPVEYKTQSFVKYLKSTVAARPSTYVLPTVGDSGAALGFPESRLTHNELMDFTSSTTGQLLFGPLTQGAIGEVKMCGAFFDQCLRSTLTHLIGRVPLTIVDNLSLASPSAQERDTYQFSIESTRELRALARRFLSEDDPHTIRREILELLSPYREVLNPWQLLDEIERIALERIAPGLGGRLNLVHPTFLPEPNHEPLFNVSLPCEFRR